MQPESIYGSVYKGSKAFNQWDVPTANATGFGAAADDYMERGIDLNEQLIRNKPATFFFRMCGDTMTGAGIYKGDVLIVDRSIKAVPGKVIVAVLDDEMLVRRLEYTPDKIRLVADAARLSALEVNHQYEHFAIWGVVTYVIHSL
ncbi:LexA family protein [Deminuibacter soli]|uniref:LexA family transcriptional regulator n=1 Tax=Deminuibacter soli TaxID=2291815 RepID=A0A3E1NPH0_9BACT|nr:translesion error-prone DNA polymerase V autoproteolytic subunit [Deminuibacter soli]RFM29839.1 LexA family transcriptional regulator [Deminuibacter soli]